jgi:hypothetical protein
MGGVGWIDVSGRNLFFISTKIYLFIYFVNDFRMSFNALDPLTSLLDSSFGVRGVSRSAMGVVTLTPIDIDT